VLTAKQLCQALSIERKQLDLWIAEGLPRDKRRRRFDADAVAGWLVEHDKAEIAAAADASDRLLLRTIGQVARHFSVSSKCVERWLERGMPGKPGNRGRQDGFFSIPLIVEWLDRRRGTGPADDVRNIQHARLHKARAELIELELGVRRGNLIEAEEIARRWVRSIHEAKAQLGQLNVRLPRSLPERFREKRRKLIQRVLAETYQSLELALQRQADEAVDGIVEQAHNDGARGILSSHGPGLET